MRGQTEIVLQATLKDVAVRADKDGGDPLPKLTLAVEYSTEILRLMPRVGQAFRIVFVPTQLELPTRSEREPVGAR